MKSVREGVFSSMLEQNMKEATIDESGKGIGGYHRVLLANPFVKVSLLLDIKLPSSSHKPLCIH